MKKEKFIKAYVKECRGMIDKNYGYSKREVIEQAELVWEGTVIMDGGEYWDDWTGHIYKIRNNEIIKVVD